MDRKQKLYRLEQLVALDGDPEEIDQLRTDLGLNEKKAGRPRKQAVVQEELKKQEVENEKVDQTINNTLELLKEKRAEKAEQPKSQKVEQIEQPSHYTQGRFEAIEIIDDVIVHYTDGRVAHKIGDALKYIIRAPHKHESPLEDLKKAAKYLEFAINRLEGKSE